MTINHYTDYGNATKIAKNYDAVISLGIKLEEKYLNPNTKYLFLNFDDVDNSRKHTKNYEGPTIDHIYEIVRFINELEETDELLIHCFAGYSRSPAAVIIAECERNKIDITEAKKNIKENRVPEKFAPRLNLLILELYLKFKGESV